MKIPPLKLLPLLVSVAIGGMGVHAPLSFAGQLKEDVVVEPGRSITPAEETILSRSAARVLAHIAAARTAIQADDPARAAAALKKARLLIDIIKSSRPTTRITDRIWVDSKKLEYQTVDEIAVDLIPIYAGVAEVEDLLPAGKAKQSITGKAGKATAGVEAVEDAVVYTEVDLPLASTEQQVIAAQGMLAKKQLNEADQALATAEDGVRVLSLVVESPMTAVRKSLWQATRDYAAGNYAAVKTDLATAGDWLTRAAQSTDRLTREEAGRLKQAINALEGKVSGGGDTTARKLEGLWHRAVALAEREAERVSLGWNKHRPTADVRADLIEAKQHIAFAENLQFYAQSSPEDIYKALDDARAALEKAAGSASIDSAGRKAIAAVLSEVAQIRSKPAVRSNYGKVRKQLSGMIHRL